MHVKLVPRNPLINIIKSPLITAWNIATPHKKHDRININKHNTRYFTLGLEIKKQEIIERTETNRNAKKRKREKEVK